MNVEQLQFIRELLKHQLINRGKILRLIDSEKDHDLKELLIRNWTIVMCKKTK